jgi:putative SOS response-associated peptidase YedK
VTREMCGRFALAFVKGFYSRFEVIDQQAGIEPRFNIAPTQTVPTIVCQSPNRVVMMRWGLVPFWAKDPRIGNKLINARAEGITTKPAFRASLKRKRCLVPATGFYEWKKTDGGKVPHYVHMRDDSFFAFAGLYDNWHGPDGSELLSFTIVTTSPNAMMKKIHNRMPVMLRQEDEGLWLSKEPLPEDELTRILLPYPSRPMAAYPVSQAVNNPNNESEDLIAPSSK